MIVPSLNPVLDLDLVAQIRGGAEIDACLPDDMPTPALIAALSSLGRGCRRSEEFHKLLQYAVGRGLTLARRRPGFLEEAGFKGFGEYESHLIATTGMSRSTLYEWAPIYEKLHPLMTRERLTEVPAVSLKMIALHVQERAQEEMLAIAPSMTFEKLKAHAEDSGVLGKPVESGANFLLGGSREQIAELKKFCADPKVQEYVGTKNAAEVLLAAIHEVQSGTSGWPIL